MVTFIHTADWQLGKPFRQFEDGLSERLRQARIDMIAKIGDLARIDNISHVVVAGDVFDQELPSQRTIQQSLDVMADYADISFWLLPGNHDPHRANGLWDQITRRSLPPNIIPLLQPRPYAMGEDTVLLPAPWVSKNPGQDNTVWMDEADILEGKVRVGVAHGSIRDFDRHGESGQKCVIAAQDRVRQAGLDYFALGDWHGQLRINDRIGYSGTPEIDSFPSNDPGWVMKVKIDGPGESPDITPVRTTQYHWANTDVHYLPGLDIAQTFTDCLHPDTPERMSLIRLKLSGQAPSSEAQTLRKFLSNKIPSLAFMEVDGSELDIIYAADDLDDLSLDGSLRDAAEQLLSIKQNEDLTIDDRRDAGRALELLIAFTLKARA